MTTDERDTTLDEMLGSGPDPATDPALPDAVDTEGSEDDLDFEDDLDTGAPRRRNGLVSSVLAAGILLVVAFTGGVLVQKHHDAGASTASLPAFSGATLPDFGSSGFTGGGSSPGSGSAPAVIGTVVSVEGSRIIVRDFSGTKHVVTTTDSTSITRSTEIPLSKLTAGTQVVVTGTKGADGTTSATAVTAH